MEFTLEDLQELEEIVEADLVQWSKDSEMYQWDLKLLEKIRYQIEQLGGTHRKSCDCTTCDGCNK